MSKKEERFKNGFIGLRKFCQQGRR